MKSTFQQRLEEIDEKYKSVKDKKKRKRKGQPKPSGLNGYLQGFNEQQAKGDAKNTLLKTVADLAGIGIGTAISAAAGTFAPLLGAALIGTGHYIGDDSGLLRIAGAATVAHSVAKSKEYRQENSTLKERFIGLKDDWLRTALLKHDADTTTVPPVVPTPVSTSKPQSLPEFKQEFDTSQEHKLPEYLVPAQTRKTPYEIEIETKQRAYEAEAEELRMQMELEDLKREDEPQAFNEPEQTEFDLSGLDEIEQLLYASWNGQRQNGDFDSDDFDQTVAVNASIQSRHASGKNAVSKIHWPTEPQPGDEDYFEQDDYDFNDY